MHDRYSFSILPWPLNCNQFCIFIATVAVVKSRDMHWGLLAQKDHKDINLSSLRMLLVADGSNPCKNALFLQELLMFEYCVLSKFCNVNHSEFCI